MSKKILKCKKLWDCNDRWSDVKTYKNSKFFHIIKDDVRRLKLKNSINLKNRVLITDSCQRFFLVYEAKCVCLKIRIREDFLIFSS